MASLKGSPLVTQEALANIVPITVFLVMVDGMGLKVLKRAFVNKDSIQSSSYI